MEATAKESRLRFEDQINDMVYARVQKALAAKGYQVRRPDTVARKWDLLANIREGPGAHARVAQGYTLGREADWPDAILEATRPSAAPPSPRRWIPWSRLRTSQRHGEGGVLG